MALIPAGAFEMGSDRGRPDETPVHQVEVDAFYIDRYETTNADYRAFILANPQWRKSAVKTRDYLKHWNGNDFPEGLDKHPVVYVSHEAAAAYCKQRGGRLPTEAEWEKAARGGKPNLLYPWGNRVAPEAANYDANGLRGGGVENMLRRLKPVGGFSPNGYGLYDMAGNVAEWCADNYAPNYDSDASNRAPASAKRPFVVRGGSWFDPVFELRCAARAYALSGAYYHIGFRCVKDIEERND
jgi:formylglycine-generating enzyme required for sulfatase activity